MAGGKRCPLSSCMSTFSTGKEKRRHVYRQKHGSVIHCNHCNEPFLSEKAVQQHMRDKPCPGGRTVAAFRPTISGDTLFAENLSTNLQRMTLRSSIGFNSHRPQSAQTSGLHSRLYSLHSEAELNRFITDEIQPQSEFSASCSSAVNSLVHFLQNNLPQDLRPRRVEKGGSLGKGTAVANNSDIDLTLVIGDVNRITELKRRLPNILETLGTYLGSYGGARVIGNTGHAIQVEITGHGSQSHSVDILPALDFDLLNGDHLNQIYQQMRQEPEIVRSFYSASLSPLQIDIIRNLPPKLKDLIRLLKYWKKTSITAAKAPTSYPLELVIIHAWQSNGSPRNFNMTGALKDVLTKLSNHRHLKAEFGDLRKYRPGMAQTGPGPYIIDPTNPFNDVYHGYFGSSWNWDAVREEAVNWLSKPLFQDVLGTW